MTRFLARSPSLRCAVSTLVLGSALGCGSSGKDAPASMEAKGSTGYFFLVTVARPTLGTVRSDDGQIDCGSAPTGTACVGRYAWNVTARLTATPDSGYLFQTWAGDCQVTNPCELGTAQHGADKYVVATFETPERLGHGNWTSPLVHGPEFLDFLAGVPNRPKCTNCHGGTLHGQGLAPSCDGCHERSGWTSWQTNCSFCHGAKTPASQAGYDPGAHPEWAAPPGALSQRLTGTPAPARTGAHAAHLGGVATDGWRMYAPPFKCETCHTVPVDLSHVKGSGARAVVTLRGAGQRSLPDDLGTYDPATGTCTTYCHGSTLVDSSGRPMPAPSWSSSWTPNPPPVTWHCDTCHGSVERIPSGYMSTGIWVLTRGPATGVHGPHDTLGCWECHYGTASEYYRTEESDWVAGPGKHVNGVKDVEFPDPSWTWDPVQGACTTSCHTEWLWTRQWR